MDINSEAIAAAKIRLTGHLRRFIAPVAMLACLTACGGNVAPPPRAEAQPPAELRTGDIIVRATVLPTTQLNDVMARLYRVESADDRVLVVVGLRRGPPFAETSVRGTVRASASNLLGKRQQIDLREVRSGGYIDYIGTAHASMPDTLQVEIDARPDGAPAAVLRFNRDFFP